MTRISSLGLLWPAGPSARTRNLYRVAGRNSSINVPRNWLLTSVYNHESESVRKHLKIELHRANSSVHALTFGTTILHDILRNLAFVTRMMLPLNIHRLAVHHYSFQIRRTFRWLYKNSRRIHFVAYRKSKSRYYVSHLARVN